MAYNKKFSPKLKYVGTEDGEQIVAGHYDEMLYGKGGDDTLEGGVGADYIDGGEGEDTANYENSFAGVTVDLTDGKGYGGEAQGDILVDIENLSGSQYDDILIGDGGDNVLLGGPGNDILKGGGGNDTLYGGIGEDSLSGGAGDDTLIMAKGADYVDGGSGIDTLMFSHTSVGVTVSLEAGYGKGGSAEGDKYVNIENVVGTGEDDVLVGDHVDNILSGRDGDDHVVGRAGNDTLFGGRGNDILEGGEGHDVLQGGSGTDELWGGTGNDRFVFDSNDSLGVAGLDLEVIGDFTAGGTEDFLDLTDSDTGYSSLADVLANAQEITGSDGFGTLIDLGPSGEVLLANVSMSDLTEADFFFG